MAAGLEHSAFPVALVSSSRRASRASNYVVSVCEPWAQMLWLTLPTLTLVLSTLANTLPPMEVQPGRTPASWSTMHRQVALAVVRI